MRKTKIICTIGPASEHEVAIRIRLAATLLLKWFFSSCFSR